MTTGPIMQISILIIFVTTPTAYTQESKPTTSQSSPQAMAEEKQRTESETKKRLERLACGPSGVHFSQRTDKEPQVLPEQPAERALIYVIRTKGVEGFMVQAKLAMDGKWMGVNRTDNYFYFEAEPGPHYFCVKAGADGGLLSLVVEKGKTYYLRQNLTMGGTDLDLLNEEQGKQYVAKFHRSVFEVKPKK